MMDVPCMLATVMADFARRSQEAYGSIRDGVFYPNLNFEIPAPSANVLVYISPLFNQDEWVSVNERVPDKKGYYLTCVDERMASKRVGVVEINECYESISGQKVVLKFQDYITHWKPLPISAIETVKK